MQGDNYAPNNVNSKTREDVTSSHRAGYVTGGVWRDIRNTDTKPGAEYCTPGCHEWVQQQHKSRWSKPAGYSPYRQSYCTAGRQQ